MQAHVLQQSATLTHHRATQAFQPQTHGALSRELQMAPKATFVRHLLSHIARHSYAHLTHRDLIRLLRLLKDSALGRDAPKPWAQDLSLRTLDGFNAQLFGGRRRTPGDAEYWQGQAVHDITYTGVAARSALPTEVASAEAAPLIDPAEQDTVTEPARSVLQLDVSSGQPPQFQSSLSQPALQAGDFAPATASNSEPDAPPRGAMDETRASGGAPAKAQWAYGQLYRVQEHAEMIELGALQVRQRTRMRIAPCTMCAASVHACTELPARRWVPSCHHCLAADVPRAITERCAC